MSAWLLYLIGDMAVRLHVHKTDVSILTPEAAGPFGVWVVVDEALYLKKDYGFVVDNKMNLWSRQIYANYCANPNADYSQLFKIVQKTQLGL